MYLLYICTYVCVCTVCMYVCMYYIYAPELCEISDLGEELHYLIAAQNEFPETGKFPERQR